MQEHEKVEKRNWEKKVIRLEQLGWFISNTNVMTDEKGERRVHSEEK